MSKHKLKIALVGLAAFLVPATASAEVSGQINHQKYFQPALVLSTVSAAIA